MGAHRIATSILISAAAATIAGPAQAAESLLVDRFTGPDGLITNERVAWDAAPSTPASDVWLVTSGSLLRRAGWGWTGAPDARSPDACSCRSTGSAVFRMVSRRDDLGDVALTLRLRTERLVSTRRMPADATDGVHLALRWRSEHETYYLSVDRRDGTMAIKRKRAGGPSNGGTYVTLAQTAGRRIPFGRTRRVRATARDVPRGVRLTLHVDGRRVLRAVDRGQAGAPPLRGGGAVAIRADNAEVRFDDVRAVALR